MDILGLDRDLEARKHMWKGLKRMPPAERIAFVQHACTLLQGPVKTRVSKDHSGTTGEAFADLTGLSAVYGVDLDDVCRLMERWLRKRGGKWPWKASSREITPAPGTPSAPRALLTSG